MAAATVPSDCSPETDDSFLSSGEADSAIGTLVQLQPECQLPISVVIDIQPGLPVVDESGHLPVTWGPAGPDRPDCVRIPCGTLEMLS